MRGETMHLGLRFHRPWSLHKDHPTLPCSIPNPPLFSSRDLKTLCHPHSTACCEWSPEGSKSGFSRRFLRNGTCRGRSFHCVASKLPTWCFLEKLSIRCEEYYFLKSLGASLLGFYSDLLYFYYFYGIIELLCPKGLRRTDKSIAYDSCSPPSMSIGHTVTGLEFPSVANSPPLEFYA